MTDEAPLPRVTPVPSFTGHCPIPPCRYRASACTVPAVIAAMRDHEAWHWDAARLRARDPLRDSTD